MERDTRGDEGQRRCADCGALTPEGFPFCGSCGHRVDATPPPPPAQRRPAAHAAPAGARPGPAGVPARATTPRPRGAWLVTAIVAIAVVVAAAVLARAPAREPSLTGDAAGRGDAGRTGTFPDAGDVELDRVRWMGRWTAVPPLEAVPATRPVATAAGILIRSTGAIALVDRREGRVRWRSELDVGGSSDPLPVDDRLVVVAGRREVSLLDAEDGSRLWRAPVDELDLVVGMAATRRTLAVTGQNGTTVVLDLARGWQRAAIPAREVLGGRGTFAADVGPVAAGDGFAVTLRRGSEESARLAVVSAGGEVRWVSAAPVVSSSAPVAGDGVVVTTDPGYGLVTYDLATGERRWAWRSTTGEEPAELRAVAITPDRARLLVVSDAPTRRVLDPRTGALIVSAHAEPLRAEPIGPVDPSGRIAAVTVGDALEVIDVATGRTELARPPFGADDRPVVDGARLLLGLPGGVVAAQPLGPEGTAWRADVAPVADCPVVASEAFVAVGGGGVVQALDAATGITRWADPEVRAREPGTVVEGPLGELAGAGDVLLEVDRRGILRARDAADGALRWTAPVGGQPLGTPVVVGDVVVVAGGTGAGLGGTADAGYLRALELADGDRRWFVPTEARLAHPPTVVGDRLVVATESGGLEAFRLDTGEPRWRVDLGAVATAAPAQRGDRIVVVSEDGELVTLATDAAEDREPTVLARTTLPVPLRRAPAVTDDAIIVRIDSRTLAAFDLDTHEPRWRQQVLTDVLTTPPTVVGDRVVVGGQRGLHGFDLAVGTTDLVAAAAVVGAPVAGAAGVVVCSADGGLTVRG